MKNILFFCLLLVMTSSIFVLTGCGNDDDGEVIVATCDDGIQNGNEQGVDCGGSNCEACEVGAHGRWQSAGIDISPLLASSYSRLVIEFRTDGTFTYDQTDLDGNIITTEGTFIQTASSEEDIWDIILTQTNPSITTEGIFRASETIMEYEVVQTNPPIEGFAPPASTAGFGSTSGGAFGEDNIVIYNVF